MQIISRARWGAQHDNGFGPADVPYGYTYLHHSDTLAPDLGWLDADRDGVDDDERAAIRTLEAIGEQRFGRGMSYTWLVPPSGRIYEGHGVDRLGAHTGGLNGVARAICLVGNYGDREPTLAQMYAVAWLLQHNKRRGWTRSAALTGGHRDVRATACPGDRAYAAIGEINRLAAGPPIDDMEDDMQLNDKFDHKAITKQPGTYGHAVLGIWQNARANRAELAGLRVAVDKLAGAVASDDLTADELRAAVKAGVAEALAEGTVQVDIDVTGVQG